MTLRDGNLWVTWVCQKDPEANVKRPPLAKGGTFQASVRIMSAINPNTSDLFKSNMFIMILVL